MKIEKIYCYPIKSLPGEILETTLLRTGQGIAGDRKFALTHATSKFSPDAPGWLHRRNFVTLARSPQIYRMSCAHVLEESTRHKVLRVICFNEDTGNTFLFDADPERTSPLSITNPLLEELLGATQPGPHTLISAPGHSLWDAPFASVSLFNMASLAELQQTAGIELDTNRFRGNIWFSGVPAWQELDWVNSTVTLSVQNKDSSDSEAKDSTPAIQLRIVDRIERCRVINSNPLTGERDALLTRHLLNTYGHCDFGVHAEIINGGRISAGQHMHMQVSSPHIEESFKPPF